MVTFKDSLIKKLGENNLRKIQAARIGIAGAGGLGSNCALNLVRVGFEKLTIVDFDVVDPSNLDRQFYFLDQVGMNKAEALKENLERVNPDLEIESIKKKIEKENAKELFLDCDVIVECLDKPEYKSMFVQEMIVFNKLIVAASGLGGIGLSDDIKVHRIKKNLIVIGDLQSDISEKPALSPRVNIVAAKQADVILDYVLTDKKK